MAPGPVDVLASVLGLFAGTASVLREPDTAERLGELVEAGLPNALRWLLEDGGPDSGGGGGEALAGWLRDAGGAFPKLAQVLALRPDLVRDERTLERLSAVLEDCRAAPREQVAQAALGGPPALVDAVLSGQAGDHAAYPGVGNLLSAGSVAQVHELAATSEGPPAHVLKVAWEATRLKMRADFKLFRHASALIGFLPGLDLSNADAERLRHILTAVALTEAATLREFDLERERRAMERVREDADFLGTRWSATWDAWARAVSLEALLGDALPPGLPPREALVMMLRQRGPRLAVPATSADLSAPRLLTMELVPGESLQALLTRARDAPPADTPARLDPLLLVVAVVAPLVGYQLLVTLDSVGAHQDPHPGNFRFDTTTRTLYLLDWGGFVWPGEDACATRDMRRGLCALVVAVAALEAHERAAERDPSNVSHAAAVAEAVDDVESEMRAIGLHGTCTAVRALLGGEDAFREASHSGAVSAVPEDLAPLLRPVAIVGGLLSGVRQACRDAGHPVPPLTLAELWRPIAERGLAD